MNEQITGSYLIRLPNVEIIYTKYTLNRKKYNLDNSRQHLVATWSKVFVDSELYLVLSSLKNNRQFKVYNLQFSK